MDEEVKLCKDCRFCKRNMGLYIPWWIPIFGQIAMFFRQREAEDFSYSFARCTRAPSLPVEINLTGGRNAPAEYSYCGVARTYTCGREAKWFEPK